LNRGARGERRDDSVGALNDVGEHIVLSAIEVHRTLGPGLLESAYQRCLQYELTQRSLDVRCEVVSPIRYGAMKIDVAHRLDMLVEGKVIVENKTVEKLLPIHATQLLTYLKLNELRLGYLINWNVHRLLDGIHRYVNNL
jgi:GxxExxY protein